MDVIITDVHTLWNINEVRPKSLGIEVSHDFGKTYQFSFHTHRKVLKYLYDSVCQSDRHTFPGSGPTPSLSCTQESS